MLRRGEPLLGACDVTADGVIHEATVELEVPFHDVDGLGVVWHGHYLKYFEAARTKLLRGLGLDNGSVIGTRYQLMVSESYCRHRRPLRYGQRFTVSARLGRVRHTIDVHFELDALGSGERCATGETRLITLDLDGRLLHRTPDAVLERLEVEAPRRD